MTNKIVKMNDARDEIAREAFAAHVQSVAFNLTLSRSMIGLLHVVRDAPPQLGDAGQRHRAMCNEWGTRLDTHWVPLLRAVERRGLVIHCPPPRGADIAKHQCVRLTRAGELVCQLLVEAGLMPEQRRDVRRRA